MPMPQPRIILEPELMYHIWTHANGDEYLFRNGENYRYFMEKYLYYILSIGKTYAYCLMPNHLHLMVRFRDEKNLLMFLKKKRKHQDKHLQGLEDLGGVLADLISQHFSNLFNSYTRAYNNKYKRKGSLFMPNFNRKLIDSEEYFARLIAYIHNNPVHHGFVSSPDEWTFSSWHAYVTDKKTHINKMEALAWFGPLKSFMAVHRELQMERALFVFENNLEK